MRDDQLATNGYVVCDILPPHLRLDMQNGFDSHLKNSPEFKNVDMVDPTWQPVLGAFSALGNPSSFHSPFLRETREKVMAELMLKRVLPMRGRNLEQLFDRILFRRKGQYIEGESLHRDSASKALPDDDIFGGWLNMGDMDQHLSCVPGTHIGVPNSQNGYDTLSLEEVKRYKPQLVKVTVPAGHLLVFYEKMVHEVASIVADEDVRRIFFGWRITSSQDPLFGFPLLKRWCEEQAVPLLKSGQKCYMFPSCYFNFPRNYPKLQTWSENTFVSSLVKNQTVKSTKSKHYGLKYKSVDRVLPSLEEMDMKYSAYEEEEVAIFMPSRQFCLKMFEHAASRKRLLLCSKEDYKSLKSQKTS